MATRLGTAASAPDEQKAAFSTPATRRGGGSSHGTRLVPGIRARIALWVCFWTAEATSMFAVRDGHASTTKPTSMLRHQESRLCRHHQKISDVDPPARHPERKIHSPRPTRHPTESVSARGKSPRGPVRGAGPLRIGGSSSSSSSSLGPRPRSGAPRHPRRPPQRGSPPATMPTKSLGLTVVGRSPVVLGSDRCVNCILFRRVRM
jgi:hypothetical protein